MPETHHRSGSRTLAALLTLVSLTTSLALTVGTAPTAEASAVRTARASYPRAIEPLAAYQPQTTCSPRAKPGVADLAGRLLRAYPATRSLGIVRACSAGGRSEHKEGRAFDWGVNAHTRSGRATVAHLTRWLFAKDRYGNRFAMARRLGIQYLIWNHRIWGSYAAGAGWRRYTGANPHTDHVHISFTWAGARGTTSFWSGKVGNVAAAPRPTLPGPPAPTPAPPSSHLAPPRPQPRPAWPLPAGPELQDETVTLPGAGDGVLTAGSLTAGRAYLVEASGTYRWGPRAAQVADAECSRAPGDSTWRRDRSVHPWDPTNDHLDLYVDGTDLLAEPDVDTGDECDTRTHTYRWTYLPQRTGRVTFQVWDPTPATDNSGALTVRVIAVTPREQMTWAVPAGAAAGVTSPGAVEDGGTYLLTVSGVVDLGGGVTADARCSTAGTGSTAATSPTSPTSPTGPTWRPDHSVLVDHDDVSFEPVTDPDGDGCDATGHAYRLVTTAQRTAPLNLRLDDPTPADDTGVLTAALSRVRPVVDTETVTVDATTPAVTSARTYLAGQPLRITATGTYRWSADTRADAECSATTADPTWRSTRSTLFADGQYLGDVTINGSLPDWRTLTGARCDTTTHTYTVTWTPWRTGPVTLGVADPDLTDNSGTVAVTIGPAQ